VSELYGCLVLFATENGNLLKGMALGSLGFFVLTPLAAPVFLVMMPADILVRSRRRMSERATLGKLGFVFWHIFKNLIAVALMLLGILLLFLPGQGLLTLFAGTMLADIPGKKALLHRLLKAKGIKSKVDRLRVKYRKIALIYPDRSSTTTFPETEPPAHPDSSPPRDR
jgi:hypothetical protein